jgi:hypothetical protein
MGEYGSGSECCVRIERFTNGYTVEIKDPAIVKENNKPFDSKKATNYRDPWKSFVFKTDTEVIAFLTKNLKKAIVKPDGGDDEFGTAFVLAAGDE